MANQWVEYIRKLDNLILEALRACAKNSMQSFYNTLHGDGTMGPSPLLSIDIDLKENKVVEPNSYFKSKRKKKFKSILDQFLSITKRNIRLFG